MASRDEPAGQPPHPTRKQRVLRVSLILFMSWMLVGQPLYDRFSKAQIANTQVDVGCNYGLDTPGTHAAPFVYYRYSESSSSVINATLDSTTGLCIFPGASCGGATSSKPCCKSSAWSNSQFQTSQWVFNLASNVIMFLPIYLVGAVAGLRKPQQPAEPSSRQPLLEPAAQQSSATSPQRSTTCLRVVSVLGVFLFLAAIGLEIYGAIMKQQMTQELLPLVERNAMVSTDAFLTPVHEVFQFLEDVVTVKINFAIVAGSLEVVRSVVGVGVFGGLLLGAAGASIVTAIASSPGAVSAILVPSAGPDSLYSSCSLLPDVHDIVSRSYLYLVLSAWRWPMSFANMALRGYLFGCGNFKIMGILFVTTVLENGVKVLAFVLIFPRYPHLSVLAWFDIAGSAAAFITNCGAILYLLAGTRQKPTLSRETSREASAGSLTRKVSETFKEAHGIWQSAVREGLCAMSLDLSLQLCISAGVYATGAWIGSGGLYQISSIQCALAQYGMSTVSAISYQLKMQGASLIGNSKFQEFRKFIAFSTAMIIGVGVCGIFSTLPFRAGLSFSLGNNACEYASEAACLPVYSSVFGGVAGAAPSSLQASFDVFAPVLFSYALFRVLKVALYCCFDFAFMALVGAATFVCVFLPSFFYIASLREPSPSHILLMMYAPAFFMSFAFLARLHFNVERMLRGEQGAWSNNSLKHAQASILVSDTDAT